MEFITGQIYQLLYNTKLFTKLPDYKGDTNSSLIIVPKDELLTFISTIKRAATDTGNIVYTKKFIYNERFAIEVCYAEIQLADSRVL